jgi:hypothetical protein
MEVNQYALHANEMFNEETKRQQELNRALMLHARAERRAAEGRKNRADRKRDRKAKRRA